MCIFIFPPASLWTVISLTFSILPGIRLLYGTVTDAMEATALTFNTHFIDIYVCSWGPRDDGSSMDGPHTLTEQALRLGTHKARLSSLSSHCCLSDVKQTFSLSVEQRLEGHNVKSWDSKARFKFPFLYFSLAYKMYVHDKWSIRGGFKLLYWSIFILPQELDSETNSKTRLNVPVAHSSFPRTKNIRQMSPITD